MLPENKRQVQTLRAKQAGKTRVSLGDDYEFEQLLAKGEKSPLEITPVISSVLGKEAADSNKRRFVNESAQKKSVIFQNATAGWLREESGSNTGNISATFKITSCIIIISSML